MITAPVSIPDTTFRVTRVELRPRFRDWRERDVSKPTLGFCVKGNLPVPGTTDVVEATIWIPTELDPASGGGNVFGIGFESGTPPVPEGHRDAAKTVMVGGRVALDKDGLPLVDGTEKPGTSHWAVARFIPVKAGASLKVTGGMIFPKRMPDGPTKGVAICNGRGTQCVNLTCTDWEATVAAVKTAGAPGPGACCEKGARVPAFLQE